MYKDGDNCRKFVATCLYTTNLYVSNYKEFVICKIV